MQLKQPKIETEPFQEPPTERINVGSSLESGTVIKVLSPTERLGSVSGLTGPIQKLITCM